MPGTGFWNLLTEQTEVGVCLLGHHGDGFLVRCMAARWNCIVCTRNLLEMCHGIHVMGYGI
jgi:hypothetical protein